jgi:hypothetical protein
VSKPENENSQVVTQSHTEVPQPMVHAVTTVTYTKQDVLDIIDHIVDAGIRLATAIDQLNSSK